MAEVIFLSAILLLLVIIEGCLIRVAFGLHHIRRQLAHLAQRLNKGGQK